MIRNKGTDGGLRVRLGFSGGLLRSCSLRGHALNSGEPGFNLSCAAASVLARTAARTLAARPALVLRGQAPQPGLLEFEIVSFSPSDGEWLKGVGDTLKTGFQDLQEESPGSLSLEMGEE